MMEIETTEGLQESRSGGARMLVCPALQYRDGGKNGRIALPRSPGSSDRARVSRHHAQEQESLGSGETLFGTAPGKAQLAELAEPRSSEEVRECSSANRPQIATLGSSLTRPASMAAIPHFGVVVGISLGAVCQMRFRKYNRVRSKNLNRDEVLSIELQPRGIYLMSGASREIWQHSIPPVKELRYSIMMRTVRGAAGN